MSKTTRSKRTKQNDNKINSKDELAQNKLMILYLLKKMNMPVSLAHIQNFALSAEYMDFFSLTGYLADMTAKKQITKTKENNQTCYSITITGLEALSFFENMIAQDIKEHINNYVNANKPHLKDDLYVGGEYEQISEDNYKVDLSFKENSETLININLSSLSKEQAKKICGNWKKNTSDLYLAILKGLLEEK